MSEKYKRAEILERIESETFDVVIIGGGITGAGVARDAAMRGLKTLVVDKSDFAFGTSWRSSKLVHGGLRYVAQANFKVVFESCNERWKLMTQIAPHIVKPMNFIIPSYKGRGKPRWMFIVGLIVYEILSFFKNYKHFKTLSKKKLPEIVPEINQKDLVGGVSYYDCTVLDYRLVLETLKSAQDNGATLLNYWKADRINYSPDHKLNIVELENALHDSEDRKRIHVKTKAVVNAGGVWADDILQRAGKDERFNLRRSCGIHLLFDSSELKIDKTIAFESPVDDRIIFAIPWGNRVVLGTTDRFSNEDPDDLPIVKKSIDYLLDSFNAIFPDVNLTRDKILSAYAGVRPLVGGKPGADETRLPRDFQIRMSDDGLISITGGKLTTYRHMSKALVDKMVKAFFKDKELKPCSTISPISGGDFKPLGEEEKEKILSELNIAPEVLKHLAGSYGSNFKTILDYVRKNSECGQSIYPGASNIWAEIDYFIDHEFAFNLLDIMLRRTTFFLFLDNNGLGAVDGIARYMAKKLNWSEEKVNSEITLYKEYVANMKKYLE
ncbi:glycerol-3-phosphate dehydrogenase/oxidase [Bdellovibrionota bacterium]